MKKMLSVYWWPGKDGAINIGDEINRHIVAFAYGGKVKWANLAAADLLAIGSVLQFPQDTKKIDGRKSPYHVWGSGTLSCTAIHSQEKFILSAVRGPLTHSLFSYRDGVGSVPYGDPGLLACEVWPQSAEKKYAWGLVPHHSQRDKPWVERILAATPNAVLIDTSDPDIESSMKKLSACERVASTSLHGLILADAYRIPNVWLWDNALHRGGVWKFLDYFAGVQRCTADSIACSSVANLDAIDISRLDFRHFSRIDMINKTLLSAFPY